MSCDRAARQLGASGPSALLLPNAGAQTEDRAPVFRDGQAVLAALTAEEIGSLARRWGQLHRETNPGLALDGEELEYVKKNSVPTPLTGCAGGC